MAAAAPAALSQLLEPHGILAWLATYLVHSTLLLAGAWVAARWLRGRSLQVEERLWKAALVGGLLTATVQTGLAALPALPDGTAESTPALVQTVAASPASPVAWSSAAATEVAARAVAPDRRLRDLGAVLPGWQRFALAGWLLGSLVLAGGLALAWLRLRWRLRGREDLAAAPAARLLDRLLASTARRRRVRLTGTSALPVPVALGVGEREICLPRRVLRDLDERRQAGLLAHELAHLERRDPAWLLGALALQSVFFFQPLNRLARRRLEEIAELRCDDWAVRATGDRVGLARCLTEVASWLVAERSPLPVPGMARRNGHLTARVRRILEGDGEEPARGRWLPVAAAAALLAGVLLVPGLAPATFAEPDVAAASAPVTEPATPPAEEDPAGEPEASPAADPEADRDVAADHDSDHDSDYDIDVDLDPADLPDAEEISRLVADAMAAARDAMPDPKAMAELQEQVREAVETAIEAQHEALEMRQEALEEARRALAMELDNLPEGKELSPEERAHLREQIDRELAGAREEMERALQQARPALEELERMNGQIQVDVYEAVRRAHEELARAEREAQRHVERETRVEREEVRRELERELRDARRQLEQERRNLEEEHRQLERERRELEREKARIEREGERVEREAPPPPTP